MSSSFGKLLLVSLSVSLCLSLASWAEADLVSRDLYEPGDGLLTYDELNQREWLDFTETGKYANEEDFLTAISPGGELEDFHFARQEDLLGLLGLDEIVDRGWTLDPSVNPAPRSLIILLGWTVEASGSILGKMTITSGLVETDQGDIQIGPHHFDGTTILLYTIGEELIPGAINRPVFGRNDLANVVVQETPVIFNLPVFTFWMFREAAIATVPEPSTLGIAIFACLAFSAYSPRSKTP